MPSPFSMKLLICSVTNAVAWKSSIHLFEGKKKSKLLPIKLAQTCCCWIWTVVIQLCPVQCCSFLIHLGITIKLLMCLSFFPFLSALWPGMSSKEIYGNSCFGISYVVLGIFWFLYDTGFRTSRRWRKLLECMIAPALLSLYKIDFVN